MRILGIDPGIQITGYCILDCDGDNYSIVTSGSIQTSKENRVSQRLLEIFCDIEQVCKKYKPEKASIEQVFFFKNQKTIIPVLEARGVILAALEKMKVPIFEYTPMVVKQVLTGNGRAQKSMVECIVKKTLDVAANVKLDDTIDAIAIAICHQRNEEVMR